MYADDTIIMFTGTSSTFIKDMTTGLEQVSKWLHEHKLTLNVSKTNFMLLGTCRRLTRLEDIQITLNGDFIERVKVYKYIGVVLDECLSWSEQIDVLPNLASLLPHLKCLVAPWSCLCSITVVLCGPVVQTVILRSLSNYTIALPD